MKRLALVLGVCLALVTHPVAAKTKNSTAEKSVEATVSSKETKQVKEEMLMSRLNTIHKIALNGNLTAMEKIGFRKEVKDIQKELKQMQGFYVYLSLTALIVILILLLLL